MTAARVAVSVILLCLLFWLCERETAKTGRSVWDTMRSASPLLLGAAFLLYVASMVLVAYRWQLLLRACGVRIGLWPLTRAYLIGFFFNNFLPSSVGGDVARIVQLASRGTPVPVSFASVFVERLLGFLAMAALSVGSLVFLWDVFHQPVVLAIVFGLGAAFLAVAWACFDARGARFARAVCVRLHWKGIGAKMQQAYDAVHAYRGHHGTLWAVFVISLAYQLVLGVFTYMVTTAAGLPAGFLLVFALMQVTSMAGIIPVTLETAGMREGIYMLVLGSLGISKSATLGAMLLVRLLSIAGSALGGLCMLGGAPKVRGMEERVVETAQ